MHWSKEAFPTTTSRKSTKRLTLTRSRGNVYKQTLDTEDPPKGCPPTRATEIAGMCQPFVGIIAWLLPSVQNPKERLAIELLSKELEEWINRDNANNEIKVEICDYGFPGCIVAKLECVDQDEFEETKKRVDEQAKLFIPVRRREATRNEQQIYQVKVEKSPDHRATRRDLLWRRARPHGNAKVQIVGSILDEEKWLAELAELPDATWLDYSQKVFEGPCWAACATPMDAKDKPKAELNYSKSGAEERIKGAARVNVNKTQQEEEKQEEGSRKRSDYGLGPDRQ
ncbi:unnamed protein product, partial [Mesorhabditis spiculigera]